MKHFQTGRSMVEMLGVMALIGVLSIAALAGFRLAMNKKTANDLLEEVRLAVLSFKTDAFMTSLTVGQNVSAEQLGFSSAFHLTATKESAFTFYIEALALSEKVCLKIMDFKPTYLEEIVANEGAGCEAGGQNLLRFYANDNLDETLLNPDRYERCDTTADCPGGQSGCAVCQKGICVDMDEKCSQGYCVYGECAACRKGEFMTEKGGCQSCFGTDNWASTETECNKCPLGTRMWRYAGGLCFSCEYGTTDARYISKEQCLRCPGRYWSSLDAVCLICRGTVAEDGTTCQWSGTCQTGEFMTENGCVRCDAPYDGTYDTTSQEECAKCGSLRYWSWYGHCMPCSHSDVDTTTGWAVQAECERCPNRYFTDQQPSLCRLCPADVTTLASPTEASCLRCHGVWQEGACQNP